MKSPIFKVVPEVKPSLLQRLFKQLPIDNAIIELNNLLATRNILSIQSSELRAIEDKYEVSLAEDYSLNLQEFYAVLWNCYVKKDESSAVSIQEIDQLAALLQLTEATVRLLKDRIGSEWYRKLAAKCVAKRRLLPNDKINLDIFANHLQLDADITAKILEDEQQIAVKTFINGLVKKARCSPEERMEADRMFESFNVLASLRGELNKQLRLYVTYWEADFLPLKSFPVAEGVLQKSETCYYHANRVKWYETRNSRYGVKKLELINEGDLYLTNKRLVFIGVYKTSQIPFDRILRTFKDNQQVTVIKDKGKNPTLKLPVDSELFSIILKRVKSRQLS